MTVSISLLLLLVVTAATSASPVLDAPLPLSTACGDIVSSYESNDNSSFPASLAYECLTSVPFNPAVAAQFLSYYNQILPFQSTLELLKDPPKSYQQPAVDLVGGLAQLQQGINDNIFPNQYEFEAALQRLLYAAHDGHLNVIAGALAVFSFGSTDDIVSISLDGIQEPKVYLKDDVVLSHHFTTYTPSHIASINGIETTTYLTEYAANNSFGSLEPHADWNQLMFTAAQDIQGYFSAFGGSTFYSGNEITFKLENGTDRTRKLFATYYDQGPTGPLQTGGDFYNSFVLGLYPDSFDPDFVDDSNVDKTATSTSYTGSEPTTAPSSEDKCATSPYPCLHAAQQTSDGEAALSGYIFDSASLGAFSIRSFDGQNDTLNIFQSAVADFITKSREANVRKIVIDLQANLGGQPLLAIDTFKRFFPNIDPFAGSRMRAQNSTDVMGQTLTNYYQTLNDTADAFYTLAANEWIANRINADTNATFSSWPEFFGPHTFGGDDFTTTQRYNLSDLDFVQASVGFPLKDFEVSGYNIDSSRTGNSPPYAAENIVILSDGTCGSACALFIEMMHHEAGVKVVAVGGRPTPGPMQVSSTRGAALFNTDVLDSTIDYTERLLNDQNLPDANFLPGRTEELDFYITYASINLRDQIRRGGSTPLQFAYEAADCRIYYTPQTILNYTALWQYTADAIWNNSTLCVANSTGFGSKGVDRTDFTGPPNSISPSSFSLADVTKHLSDSTISIDSFPEDGLEDFEEKRKAKYPKNCETFKECGGGYLCVWSTACGWPGARRICLPICSLDPYKECNPGAKCTAEPPVCTVNEGRIVCSTDIWSITGNDSEGVCPKHECGGKNKKAGAPPGIPSFGAGSSNWAGSPTRETDRLSTALVKNKKRNNLSKRRRQRNAGVGGVRKRRV